MISIIQGGNKNFTVRIKSEATGDPLSLAGLVEISTCFLNIDGTELMKTYTASGGITVVSAPLGKIQIALSAAETALLAVVESSTLEISIDLGSGPVKFQIEDAYEVLATVC